MLPVAVTRAVAHGIEPRSVVVAIVGGTLLTLALTRPRLRWMERLTDQSKSQRLWAERGLTLLAFVMGGYAADSLVMVLHKQLGSEVGALMWGAAVFLMIYAWLVHFEPFIAEWRLCGGVRAGVLYTGVAVLATIIGAATAETLIFSINGNRILLLAIGIAVAVGCWVVYRFLPRLELLMDHLFGLQDREDSTKSAIETEGV
jgi:hypothetical protein